MTVLVLGSEGQLGRALQAVKPGGIELVAPPERECDIANSAQLEKWFADLRPSMVINAAAYTAVDAAEQDAKAAEAINTIAVAELARLAKSYGAHLIHVSTDFVFDGTANRPYKPGDTPNPLSVYGTTKLAGERAIVQSGADALILRTAWVYAERGRNFVATILRLLGQRDEINVVADQIGTPTYARNLASALWGLAQKGEVGIFHFTDSGVASWYDFAVAIREEALALGLLSQAAVVLPVGTADYPTPARRPAYSVLDKSAAWAVLGHRGQHWRKALRAMLKGVEQDG